MCMMAAGWGMNEIEQQRLQRRIEALERRFDRLPLALLVFWLLFLTMFVVIR